MLRGLVSYGPPRRALTTELVFADSALERLQCGDTCKRSPRHQPGVPRTTGLLLVVFVGRGVARRDILVGDDIGNARPFGQRDTLVDTFSFDRLPCIVSNFAFLKSETIRQIMTAGKKKSVSAKDSDRSSTD